MRQLYSVIYDMSCGCDVMSAAGVQLTPKTLAFTANRNIAGTILALQAAGLCILF
jgi:hypothetical protein